MEPKRASRTIAWASHVRSNGQRPTANGLRVDDDRRIVRAASRDIDERVLVGAARHRIFGNAAPGFSTAGVDVFQHVGFDSQIIVSTGKREMRPLAAPDADRIGSGRERRGIDADVGAAGTFVGNNVGMVVAPMTARHQKGEERDNEDRFPHGSSYDFERGAYTPLMLFS